jgi:hypothetical protein
MLTSGKDHTGQCRIFTLSSLIKYVNHEQKNAFLLGDPYAGPAGYGLFEVLLLKK